MARRKRSKSSLKHPIPGLPDISLTKRQQKLADIIVFGVENAEGVAETVSITKAAPLAGYAKGDSGRVTASRTLRLPHVQAYIFQKVAELVGMSAIGAAQSLAMLSKTANSEYVKLEASKDILDRAGFKAPDKVSIQQEVSITIDLG
jgi:phage terminase small subunit